MQYPRREQYKRCPYSYDGDGQRYNKGQMAERSRRQERIQEAAQGYVVPDSFTHGTSDQRIRWFYKGFEAGDLENGDTFKLSENEL